MINKLESNQIFVFGSNEAGNHAGGAALQAKNDFGAESGIGEGLTGKCYAFPTLTKEMKKRPHSALELSVKKLYAVAKANPNKEFLLTKVGCGIAGYPEFYIRTLFKKCPENITLPVGWKPKESVELAEIE